MQQESSCLGGIIKAERLKQNRTQKDICYGICVPSYLSKIENEMVKPDEEILEKIYKKLNLTYLRKQEDMYSRLQNQIKDYFYKLQYNENTNKLYESLKKESVLLKTSEFAIDWLLIQGYEEELKQDALLPFVANMTPSQYSYYQFMQTDFSQTDRIAEQEKAAKILSNSFAWGMLCVSYFHLGDYIKIHQMENMLVTLAVEEGNTYQLANYYFLNGTAYACLNMEEMMMINYKRTIHFLQNTMWESELTDIYYNIGATYISLKKYEKALEYLYLTDERQMGESFSTNQKIAITYARNKEYEKAKKVLEKIKIKFLKEEKDSLTYLMYEEVKWECRDGFLYDSKYLVLLEKLTKKIKKERHFGYLYFYQDVITQAYTNQRQYKKAAEFLKENSAVR